MRVFLIEQPRSNIDLTTAEDFGELCVLFPINERRTSVFNCTEFGEQVVDRLRRENFCVKKDFICVAGSMITMIVAISAILAAFKMVTVLFFNATTDHYVARILGHENNDQDTRQGA